MKVINVYTEMQHTSTAQVEESSRVGVGLEGLKGREDFNYKTNKSSCVKWCGGEELHLRSAEWPIAFSACAIIVSSSHSSPAFNCHKLMHIHNRCQVLCW